MNSQFWNDGYSDAINGHPYSPPADFNGSNVLEQEYRDGFEAGKAVLFAETWFRSADGNQ